MNLPSHFELARPAWRFAAGVINLIAVDFIAVIARLVVDGEDRVRMIVLIGVTAFWLVCALRKKSLGGAFCLLEIRHDDFAVLPFTAHLFRTLPFYLLAFLACLPLGILPSGIAQVQPLLLLSLIGALTIDAMCLVITGRSLIDRWRKTAVLRLNLPEHLRPRIFGIRTS